ncbi:MAG: bifunctional lysylphosphatidylglycerol flippase/synthetase MprF [Thermodesulfobacteriota bacterium]
MFLLSFFSIVFHLTKGLDYEEALLSLILLILLIFSRKDFTVKSSIPTLSSGILRFLIAIIISLAYGIIGFWFLDKKDFGINFTISDSIYRTIQFLSLVWDTGLVPKTRYAAWFLDSLSLLSLTAIIYAVFSLFRPAVYRLKTLPAERDQAKKLVIKYGRSAIDYFKLWHDKSYFFSQSKNTFLAYRVAGGFAVVLGDPVGHDEEIEEIIHSFADYCKEMNWRIGFYQAMPDFLPIYTSLVYKKLKIGDDAIVDLTKFTIEGKDAKDFRYIINKMEKLGISIIQYEPPIADNIVEQVKKVSGEWLQIPGRRERGFALGSFEPCYIKSTLLFTVVDNNGKILAFVNIFPSYTPLETTFDLMRRKTEAPHGVMDYLFVKLLLINKEKNYERFNFGMAPMSGFSKGEEASSEEKAIHNLFQHLNFLFSFTGLKQYKAKFATSWEPRYIVYQNTLDLPCLGIAISKVSQIKRRK